MQFAFVHLRILDVAKGSMLKAHKMQLHELCYTVLSSDEVGDTALEVLASHKEHAGDLRAAVKLQVAATQKASKLSDYDVLLTFALKARSLFAAIEADEPLGSDEWVALKASALFQASFANDFKGDNPELTAAIAAEYDALLENITIDKYSSASTSTDLLEKKLLGMVMPMFGTMFDSKHIVTGHSQLATLAMHCDAARGHPEYETKGSFRAAVSLGVMMKMFAHQDMQLNHVKLQPIKEQLLKLPVFQQNAGKLAAAGTLEESREFCAVLENEEAQAWGYSTWGYMLYFGWFAQHAYLLGDLDLGERYGQSTFCFGEKTASDLWLAFHNGHCQWWSGHADKMKTFYAKHSAEDGEQDWSGDHQAENHPVHKFHWSPEGNAW